MSRTIHVSKDVHDKIEKEQVMVYNMYHVKISKNEAVKILLGLISRPDMVKESFNRGGLIIPNEQGA